MVKRTRQSAPIKEAPGKLGTGSRVEAQYRSDRTSPWLKGVVKQERTGSDGKTEYQVKYDQDGELEWLKAKYVRIFNKSNNQSQAAPRLAAA